MSERTKNRKVNVTALTFDQAAEVLKLPIGRIRQDTDSGCPTNPDGTLNLVVYAAWLIAERQGGR